MGALLFEVSKSQTIRWVAEYPKKFCLSISGNLAQTASVEHPA